jgi:NADH:ubiquinone oxidoreductase subunit 5 (subunit L)/multisubunit Na+/H+ antiporter MnhA subunit
MNTLDCLLPALAATVQLVWLAPLLPLLAAAMISLHLLARRQTSDAQEPHIAGLASGAALGVLLLLLVFDLSALGGALPGYLVAGDWLVLSSVPVRLSFIVDATSLSVATLVALIGWIVLRFSTTYLHREPGYRRYFLAMSLFLSGMLLIVLGGNLVLVFTGWELCGFSSWMLIGYAWHRPQASANALFAFLTNRVGDAGFLLGIALAVWSVGTTEWPGLAGDGNLATVTVRLLVFGLVVAALAKSAQLPFSPWIARALEGPTPSSAVFYGSLMVHAGVYLLIRLEPLLVQVPDIMALIAIAGAMTALYGYLCALVQSDVKSALIFSTVTQVGLMFVACGLGFFELATWHLCLHAAWRAYQFLLAPSYMHLVGQPARPVPHWLAARPWLYTAALQRFWIESLAHSLLTRPTLGLGRDVRVLDEQVIDRIIGVPLEDAPEDARDTAADDLIRGHGLAGRFLFKVSEILQQVEARLLLSGSDVLRQRLRRAGEYMEAIDLLIEHPRYLMLMVMATFVVIL